jgi:hypothetical protein
LLTSVEQALANIDPNLNLTNVTYGELAADFHTLYADFINWYGTFFGSNGLINVSEIQDGGVVYRFTANVSSFNLGEDMVDVERPDIFPIQLASIADWISTKFGSVILSNSCALCAANNGSLSNSTVSNNSTSNSSSSSNNTNSTMGS